MLHPKRRHKKNKCICDTLGLLKRITRDPTSLPSYEINQARLNLFTDRNSDGTGYLILRGNDLYDRYEQRIQDTDIRAICIYCREAKRRITKLDLSYNNITDKGFFKLLKKLLVKGRSSILELNIMNNDITHVSMSNIALYANYITLKRLRISGNELGIEGGIAFSKFLYNNTSLEYADIGQTGQNTTTIAQIITALRPEWGGNTTLKVLDFSRIDPLFNRYSYESRYVIYHFEFLLKYNKTIIELHLQKNELTCHDMEYLVRGLYENKTLLYLDLAYNRIGEYGIELISRYLETHPNLQLLNVSTNHILETGAKSLSYGLPFSKVRALDISYNRINENGILAVLSTVKKFTYMRFLNIFGNTLSPICCEVLHRMLDSGALFQHTIDVKIYEVDGVYHAGYSPNPADKSKHLYYNEMETAVALPIYHIKRNNIPEKKKVKFDCKFRHKLDKTDETHF